MEGNAGGRLERLTLRFVDDQREESYQRSEGAIGRIPATITAGAAVLLWLIAALLLPNTTQLPTEHAVFVPLFMSLVSGASSGVAYRTTRLDGQHLNLALLTSANGLVIMLLAAAADVFPGYAVSAISLLLIYGFVSRTRFIFATLRSVVMGLGFFYLVLTYRGSANLLIDSFIFVALVVGSLLALRLLEISRRRIYYQQGVISQQAAELEVEKDKSERVLLNVLPPFIVQRLREGETKIADDYPSVTVLFADIVGFTPLAAVRPAPEVIHLLGDVFSRFDELVAERGLEKIKTIGDAYMAAGGLTDSDSDHARRVVELGLAMQEEAQQRAGEWANLQLRIGVHTGPASGGVIGRHKFAFDLWGDTINMASRLEQHGLPGRVHLSAETWSVVRDHFSCELRGDTELRGRGGVQTYLVVGRRAVGHGMPEATPPAGQDQAAASA